MTSRGGACPRRRLMPSRRETGRVISHDSWRHDAPGEEVEIKRTVHGQACSRQQGSEAPIGTEDGETRAGPQDHTPYGSHQEGGATQVDEGNIVNKECNSEGDEERARSEGRSAIGAASGPTWGHASAADRRSSRDRRIGRRPRGCQGREGDPRVGRRDPLVPHQRAPHPTHRSRPLRPQTLSRTLIVTALEAIDLIVRMPQGLRGSGAATRCTSVLGIRLPRRRPTSE